MLVEVVRSIKLEAGKETRSLSKSGGSLSSGNKKIYEIEE